MTSQTVVGNKISNIVSIELFHLNTDEIEEAFNKSFKNATQEQNEFFKNLIANIKNTKKSIISGIDNLFNDDVIIIFANHLKNLMKLYKQKFKALYDSFGTFKLNLNSLSDSIKNSKTNYAIERIGKIEELLQTIKSNVTSVDDAFKDFVEKAKKENNLSTSTSSTISNSSKFQPVSKNKSFINAKKIQIPNKRTDVKTPINIKKRYKNTSSLYNSNSILTNERSLSKNSNNTSLSKSNNKRNASHNRGYLSDFNVTDVSLNSTDVRKNNSINISNYIKKNRDLQSQVEKLKSQLKEKTPLSVQVANIVSLSSKINKVIEMVVSYSYSMNNLRDSMMKHRTTMNIIDAKYDYNQLSKKLISISKEIVGIGNDFKKINVSDVENLIYASPRKVEENQSNGKLINDNPNPSSSFSFNTTPNSNNTKVITFRNDPTARFSSKEKNESNSSNSSTNAKDDVNIFTLNNALKSKNEKLEKEIKELKEKLATEILTVNTEDKTDEIYQLKREIDKLKNDLIKEREKAKNLLVQKQSTPTKTFSPDTENETLLANTFQNLKETYEKNIATIKKAYDDVIKEKEKIIGELQAEVANLNEAITQLKEEASVAQAESRKNTILYESSLNTLINEKISLEIEIQHLKSEKGLVTVNSNPDDKISQMTTFIENQKIQIQHLKEIVESKDKMITTLAQGSSIEGEGGSLEEQIASLKNEISEKNKQINILTENHQNDLNELNTSIILLKSQIAKLQEENISLSYSQRNNI